MIDENDMSFWQRYFDNNPLSIIEINRSLILETIQNRLLFPNPVQLHEKYDATGIYTCPIPVIIPMDFESESREYLDLHYSDRDSTNRFYTELTSLWNLYLRLGMYCNAKEIWRLALDITNDCIHTSEIHMGIPYYFYGATCLIVGEVEKGFVMIHRALKEDKRNLKVQEYLQQPAYLTVTLEYKNPDNFLRHYLDDLREYLKSKIASFDDTLAEKKSPQMGLDKFKKNFLEARGEDTQDIVFFFIYLLDRLRRQETKIIKRTISQVELMKTEFGSLIESDLLFDLCLITDCAIEEVFNKKERNNTQRPQYWQDYYRS
ncbi:MAG: hypothetical protein ACTSPB_26635 [Candidatus Thorarchaeota archaeon]